MASGNFTTIIRNDTLNNFKSWAMSISGAFQACGWTKHPVAGQTDFSTIPTLGSLTGAWEIWGMADSFQGTSPCWVKLHYRNFDSYRANLVIVVGTGVDGAGEILNPSTQTLPGTHTNIVNPHMFHVWGKTSSWQVGNSFACSYYGDSGSIYFALGENFPDYRSFFCVERARDRDYALTPDIVMLNNNRSGEVPEDLEFSSVNFCVGGKWQYPTDPGPNPHPSTWESGMLDLSNMAMFPLFDRSWSRMSSMVFGTPAGSPDSKKTFDLTTPAGNKRYVWLSDGYVSSDAYWHTSPTVCRTIGWAMPWFDDTNPSQWVPDNAPAFQTRGLLSRCLFTEGSGPLQDYHTGWFAETPLGNGSWMEGGYKFPTNSNTPMNRMANPLPTGTPITVMAWVKPKTATGNSEHIVELGGATANSRRFYLRTAPGTNGAKLSYHDNTNLWKHSTVAVDVDVWTHYAFVVTPSVSVKFYKNGTMAQEVALASQPIMTNDLFTVGTYDGGYLNAVLRDVYVYAEALSDAEINLHYTLNK